MAKNASGAEAMLPPGTLSFPNLFTAKKVDEKSDPKYSMVCIWEAAVIAGATMQGVKQDCARLLLGKYGATWLEMVKAQQLRWPFKKISGLLVKPGYPDGGEFLNFNCGLDNKPHLYDRYKDPATGKAKIVTDPAHFYAGCQVVCLVRPYLYDKGVNKGVSIGLQAVQWWAEGPRLDGRSDPVERFAAEDAPMAAMPTNGTEDPLAAMLGIADTGIGGLP